MINKIDKLYDSELEVFFTEEISRYRIQMGQKVFAAMKKYNSDTNFDQQIESTLQYAACFHLLLKLYWFPNQGEAYFKNVESFTDLFGHTSGDHQKSLLICNHKDCEFVESDIFDSNIYLIKNFVNSIDTNYLGVIDRAIELTLELGFGHLIKQNLGALIILDEKQNYSASNSYTVSSLPATIFIDFYNNVYKLGEMIVHECSHSFLNDIFASFNESFDDKVTYWSIWKGKERPIAGILHASYAFSNVILYYKSLKAKTLPDRKVYDYLTLQLKSEDSKLRSALPQIKLASNHIKNDGIRRYLIQKVELALQ